MVSYPNDNPPNHFRIAQQTSKSGRIITDACSFENMPETSSLESHLHLRFSILEAGGNETDGCRRRPTLFNRAEMV